MQSGQKSEKAAVTFRAGGATASTLTVHGLRNGATDNTTYLHTNSCQTCATLLAVGKPTGASRRPNGVNRNTPRPAASNMQTASAFNPRRNPGQQPAAGLLGPRGSSIRSATTIARTGEAVVAERVLVLVPPTRGARPLEALRSLLATPECYRQQLGRCRPLWGGVPVLPQGNMARRVAPLVRKPPRLQCHRREGGAPLACTATCSTRCPPVQILLCTGTPGEASRGHTSEAKPSRLPCVPQVSLAVSGLRSCPRGARGVSKELLQTLQGKAPRYHCCRVMC